MRSFLIGLLMVEGQTVYRKKREKEEKDEEEEEEEKKKKKKLSVAMTMYLANP